MRPDARIRALVGEVRAALGRLEAHSDELVARASAQDVELSELLTAMGQLREVQAQSLEIARATRDLARATRDDIEGLRCRLRAVRVSDEYAATFENQRPLVSVAIVTYNAADLLVDRAIDSVRAQTYDHWEIIVVGDGCTDDTAERIEQLGDTRVRFVNLPFNTLDVEHPPTSWLVSGSVPYNHAVDLARGEWIAPLGHDDEFLPHHLETLLALALERRAELAYGSMECIGPTGVAQDMFAFPPEPGQIAVQQAIYLRALDFFEYDPYSWMLDEPNDWNLIRRMLTAGVLVAATHALATRSYSPEGWPAEGEEVNLRWRPRAGDAQNVRVSLAAAEAIGGTAVLASDDSLTILTPPEPWSYAAAVPLPELGVVPLAVRATMTVSEGRVGIALLSRYAGWPEEGNAMDGEIAVEFFIDARDGERVVELPVSSADATWRFLVRNHAFPEPSRCTLKQLECIVPAPDEALVDPR